MSEVRVGRPPVGVDLVDKLDGSALAKSRLKAIHKTLAAQATIGEASAELGIGPSRFHALREESMQVWLESLEPKPPGRPREHAPEDLERIRQLQEQLQAAEQKLAYANVQLDLAAIRQIEPPLDPEQQELKKTRAQMLQKKKLRKKLARKEKRLQKPRQAR